MKTFLFSLVLLISTTSFARECNSLDLDHKFKEINAIKGLSFERRESHFSFQKEAKMTQILSCMGQGLALSAEELAFAQFELTKDKIQTIDSLNVTKRRYLSKLVIEDLSASKRELYLDWIERTALQIKMTEESFNKNIELLMHGVER